MRRTPPSGTSTDRSLRPATAPAGSSWRRMAAVLAPTLLAATAVVLLGPATPVSAAVMALGIAASAVALVHWVVTPLRAAVQREHRRADELDVALVQERAARDVQDRLDRALPMTPGEAEALRTGLRAIGELLPEASVSLLLPVPGSPTVGWRIDLDDADLRDAAPVPGGPGCAALATGATSVAASASALDACAHLHDGRGEHSAACLPVRAGSVAVAVLCVQGPPGEAPTADVLRRLEWVARRVGARVAEHRAAHGPSGSGRPDPLTGLPTRLALREQLRQMVRSLTPFCVAVLEVDGHDELPTDGDADAALRRLAEVLCATLRPDDVICRLEGARFAAVLQGCTADQATAAIERARESMVLSLAAAPDAVPMTFSAGVVASQQAGSLAQIVELAEAACDRAGDAGGNRVALAG